MLEILHQPFIQNALIAATFVAVVAGVVGYFLVMRGLTFAGHALSHLGFAGAAGALVLGIDPLLGLLGFTTIAGIAIGLMGKRLSERDTTIGIIMTLMLGLGSLFISLYQGYAERAYSILFGTILGIGPRDVIVTAVFSVATILVVLACFRPLLFASYDPEVAEARGVPVRWLSLLFLVLVAVTVSVSVQIVGVLLIFTLLVGPAATAMRLVSNPVGAICLSVLLALAETWAGIILAATGKYPVTFYIATISFGLYILARLLVLMYTRHGHVHAEGEPA